MEVDNMTESADLKSQVQLQTGCMILLIEILDRLNYPVPMALDDSHREAIKLLMEIVPEEDACQLDILRDADPFCLLDECGKDCAGIAYAKTVAELVGEEGPNRHLFNPQFKIEGVLVEGYSTISDALQNNKSVTVSGTAQGCFMGQLVPGEPAPVQFHVRKVSDQQPHTDTWGGIWVQSSLFKNWYRVSSEYKSAMEYGPAIKNNRQGEWGAELSAWKDAAIPKPACEVIDQNTVEGFSEDFVGAVATLLKWAACRCDYDVCKSPPPLTQSQIDQLRARLSLSQIAKIIPHTMNSDELKQYEPPPGLFEIICPRIARCIGGVRPVSFVVITPPKFMLSGLIMVDGKPTYVCYQIKSKTNMPFGKVRFGVVPGRSVSGCVALLNVLSEEDTSESPTETTSDSSSSSSSISSSSVELLVSKKPMKKSKLVKKPLPPTKKKQAPTKGPAVKKQKPAKKQNVKKNYDDWSTISSTVSSSSYISGFTSDSSSSSSDSRPKVKRQVKKQVKKKTNKQVEKQPVVGSSLIKPNSQMTQAQKKEILKHNPLLLENVISQPQDMFSDMAAKLTKLHPQLIRNLKGISRPIEVATMCSGTESPLLALKMFEKAFGVHIFNHVFSCEIEPYKQAYIERNFHPKLLFRDIRELANPKATTAYGSSVPVPGQVDIVIAGTVCKDFSTINKFRKGIDEGGQSGQTFKGMLDYVKKYAPKIVILENVRGAPWDEMANLFNQLKLPGGKRYHAGYLRLDTKNYYIPQTRQRGYLCAALDGTPSKLQAWGNMVASLEKFSGPVLDHFLLPDDDPRVLQAKNKVTVKLARKKIDWGRCELRHAKERNSGGLGPKRPVTNWNEGGVKPPDWSWQQWIAGQPNRVNDLIDLRYLGCGNGSDPDDAHWRCRVWNLSQNVDRGNSSARGICPCLTPTMIAYISNRGGPIIGAETLFLQGIPIDDLVLTRETDRQLADLAGNAMSSTVVGACIISSILTAFPLTVKNTKNSDPINRRTELPVLDSTEPTDFQSTFIKDVESCNQNKGLDYFLSFHKAAMHCSCESGTLSNNQIVKCKSCNYTSCVGCAGNPQHVFEPIENLVRLDFSVVHDVLLTILPKRFRFVLDDSHEDFNARVDCDNWKIYVKELQHYLESPLRYVRVVRSRKWTASYISESGSLRATLSINENHPLGRWSLYTTKACKHPFFAIVGNKKPVLTVDCIYPTDSTSFNYTNGVIKLRIPVHDTLAMTVSGSDPGDSWQVSLGLTEVSNRTIFNTLVLKNGDKREMTAADGVYQRLPKCGAAIGMLYKRDNSNLEHDKESFLYLNPDIMGEPKNDSCEIADSYSARMSAGEPTDPILLCKQGWKPGSVESEIIECTLLGRFVDLPGSLEVITPFDNLSLPKKVPTLEYNNCSLSITIAKCQVNQISHSDLWFPCSGSDISWVLASMSFPQEFSNWQNISSASKFECAACSPPQPDIKWTSKGHPYESGEMAAEYEMALKRKPRGVSAQLRRISDTHSDLRVNINPVMLVHTSSSKMISCDGQRMNYDWRALRVSDTSTGFVPFTVKELLSNRGNPEYSKPPQFKDDQTLRKEQLRSLSWMIEREDSKQIPFLQQEVENDLFCNILVEGRVTIPKIVCGGVLADEVGYGKTVISLALIAATKSDEDTESITSIASSNESNPIVKSAATLVVVPSHLISQWPQELRKFLGNTLDYIVLRTLSDLNSKSLSRLASVSVVFITTTLLSARSRMPSQFADATGRRFVFLYSALTDAEKAAMKIEQILWKRIIVDEFSFIVDNTEQLAVISNLRRQRIWLLSGTPCVTTFDDVSKMATLLGVHIGEPLVENVNKKSLTDAERFHAMSRVKSSAWYTHRNIIAQSFIDIFVRQNIAEIDELPISFHSQIVRMSHTHSSIYSELESLFKSLDVSQYSGQRWSGNGDGNDREKRFAQLLGTSSSPEEVLVKLACTYNLYDEDKSVMQSYKNIVGIRQSQLKQCAERVVHLLKEATQMRNRIRLKLKNPHFWGKMENWYDAASSEDIEVKDWLKARISEAEKTKLTLTKTPTEFELNEKVHILRSSTREYVTRVRSLRFLQKSHNIHRSDVICDVHTIAHTDSIPSEPCVTTCCGHYGCSSEFLSSAENADTCPVRGCSALVKNADIVLRSQLEDLPDNTPTKIQEVVHFIVGTASYQDEKVLVCIGV